MPKYRLKKDHYLQQRRPGVEHTDRNVWLKEPQLHEKDTIVDWDGPPSLQMEGVDKEARSQCEARRAEHNERVQKARARNGAVGWSRSFEENMRRIAGDEPAAPVEKRTSKAA